LAFVLWLLCSLLAFLLLLSLGLLEYHHLIEHPWIDCIQRLIEARKL
jgi:hypothetical protein